MQNTGTWYPIPRLVCQIHPGFDLWYSTDIPGRTALALGTMSWYSAQILICKSKFWANALTWVLIFVRRIDENAWSFKYDNRCSVILCVRVDKVTFCYKTFQQSILEISTQTGSWRHLTPLTFYLRMFHNNLWVDQQQHVNLWRCYANFPQNQDNVHINYGLDTLMKCSWPCRWLWIDDFTTIWTKIPV